MIIIFDRASVDEQRYLDWIKANPQGFVANVGRSQEDVFLHQADCSFVTSLNVAKKGFIGPQYYKICAPQSDGYLLVQWLQRLHDTALCGEVYDHQTDKCSPNLVGRRKNR